LNLIENGRIVRPYTDKRTALQYNFENTGCAGGAYDSVPSLGTCNLEINHSEKTLKELLGGRHGILVAIASGGDFTSDGQFASPVQVAYLTDGENLLGRLPELTISGSIFDFFGENLIGVSSDKIYCAGNERLAVVKLDCKRL
ncbi:MAG: metallopeptidase TldD-related protein, partial [Candidatus Riflebacteria bacterium]